MNPSRRDHPATAVALVGLLLMAACGLPGEDSVRTVEDDAVPYRLLDRGIPSRGTPPDDQLASVPLAFWVIDDKVLVPEAVDVACDGQADAIVAELLDALGAGPTGNARSVGRATAIPPESGLELVDIQDATAQVEFVPESEISADRLPVAIGQIVLAVTSAPGVEAVALVSHGESVQVPLPGGALTSGPVTASDYVPLVPVRFHDSRLPRPDLAPRLGCP